jgi:hypothetical protein
MAEFEEYDRNEVRDFIARRAVPRVRRELARILLPA